MQYLTEQDLMARRGLGQGVELHLSPEERLTPSAQELVNNRKIRILIVSGDGRVARDDGKAVYPLATEERPFAKVEKIKVQTHLNGTEMVTKEHPRIWFRGKVDSAIAAAILVQTQLQSVLAPELQGLLADLRSWLGWAMRCEVLDEAVPVLSMGPFSREAVRRLACHPEELGLEPLCPDAAEGSIFTLLNWLWAIIRETEVAAAFAFRKQDGTLERPDILELLDGLSNAVYVFMLLVKAGDRGLGAIQAARGQATDSKQILSVGIDIGTSTSQLVFSRLELCNRAAACQIPRFEITDRRIVWQSPVVFTPLTDVDMLDEAALDALIRGWYVEAGVRPEDVETGAVIVTGESLKTVNARCTAMRLADSLGDFVVASAGSHLESVIAGRGAGAAALSEVRRGTVLNIDIGGGTSNYAVFRAGRAIDTACLNMGGRLVETDGHGWITRVRKPLLPVLEELYGSRAPETLGPDDISAIADRMAGLIWQVLADERSPPADRLLQTPPLKMWRYDAVTLPGGVGACCAEPEADPSRFRDLGPSLARAIVRHSGSVALPLLPPPQTVRATVIGAGSWMLSLPGATVWADDALLPMCNLPVVSPWLDWHAGLTPAAVETAIGDAMRRMDLGDANRFVVGFPAGMPVAYATVCLLVEALAGFRSRRPEGQPVLVALAEDMGKVLGMELRPCLSGRPLVVLDELKLADGDYLDMGKPLYQGGVVPITTKSLAFSG